MLCVSSLLIVQTEIWLECLSILSIQHLPQTRKESFHFLDELPLTLNSSLPQFLSQTNDILFLQCSSLLSSIQHFTQLSYLSVSIMRSSLHVTIALISIVSDIVIMINIVYSCLLQFACIHVKNDSRSERRSREEKNSQKRRQRMGMKRRRKRLEREGSIKQLI